MKSTRLSFAPLMHLRVLLAIIWPVIVGSAVFAGESDVLDVTVNCAVNICSFSATVKHADAGWEHYADHWRVLDANGNELGRRVLLHPHDNEQPFTRSLSGVEIPAGTKDVTIESHDKVHEYGGATFSVKIP